MQRRNFLKKSIATSLALGSGQLSQMSKVLAYQEPRDWPKLDLAPMARHLYLVGSSIPGFPFDVERSPYSVRVFDHDLNFLSELSTPSHANPHGWVQDRIRPELVYGITRNGGFAWAVNTQTMRNELVLARPKSVQFWGHGAIAPNGDLLLSGFDYARSISVLLRYQGGHLVEVITIPLVGSHELAFCPENPKFLLMMNTLNQRVCDLSRFKYGSVTWYDYQNRIVAKEIFSGLSFGPSHLVFLAPTSDRVLFLGTHRVPAVEIYENGRLHLIEWPTARRAGYDTVETLNAVLDPFEVDVAWVTCPDYDLLLKLDLKEKKFVKGITKAGILHAFAHPIKAGTELVFSSTNRTLALSGLSHFSGGNLVHRRGTFGDSAHAVNVDLS